MDHTPPPPPRMPEPGRSGGYDAPPGSSAAPPPGAAPMPPPPYSGWTGAPSGLAPGAPAPRPGMAVAALVLGIVGVVGCFVFIPSILAVIFGFVAASRIKRSRAAGQPMAGWGMARAGWILGIVGLLVGIAFVIFAVVTSDDSTQLDDLNVGDCVQVDTESEDTVIYALPQVDCDELHNGEVYVVDDLDDGDFPGQAEVTQQVGRRCRDAFEDYVGATYDESELDIFFLYPQEKTWDRSREYFCIVYPFDGSDLTGSVEGSGR